MWHRKNLAVLSLAGDYRSTLLWSHYADSFRGYCVGIDVNRLERLLVDRHKRSGVLFFSDWIQYKSAFPEIVPALDQRHRLDQILSLVTIKSDSWRYEEEFRFVFKRPGDYSVQLPPQCITDVILGPQMPPKHCEEISSIVNSRYPHAKVLQARRKPLSFELEFNPVER